MANRKNNRLSPSESCVPFGFCLGKSNFLSHITYLMLLFAARVQLLFFLFPKLHPKSRDSELPEVENAATSTNDGELATASDGRPSALLQCIDSEAIPSYQ